MTHIGTPGASVPQDALVRLVRRIEDLERNQREMGPLLVLAGTTQSTNFDGVAKTNTVGTMGYGLDGPSGNAVFNNIALRGGIIGNDALSHPVVSDYYEGSGSGTLTVPGSFLLTGSINVPTGFTQAIVYATATIGGTNATGVPDNIYCAPNINGVVGQQIANSASNGFAQSVTMAQAQIITSLSGGTIQIKAWGAVDHTGWTGGDGHLSAQAIFLR